MFATAVVGLRLLIIGCALAVEVPPTVVVDFNRSTLVSLPKQPHKIFVRDPALLHVAVSPDGVILTGLDCGEISIVILDDKGTVVMESAVRVETPTSLFNVASNAYDCAPLRKLVGVASDGGGTVANAKASGSDAAQSTVSNPIKPTGENGLQPTRNDICMAMVADSLHIDASLWSSDI
jgi:hypothetical protein